MRSIKDILAGNPYPGRGVLAGKTPAGENMIAYFIMGRSENSRNRLFSVQNGTVKTEPFDASKVRDPSLIIYTAIRDCGKKLLVTNGDQTDTLYKDLTAGKTAEESLTGRTYEPDAPNYTPRIGCVFDRETGEYELFLLKRAQTNDACERFFYRYEGARGEGKCIHTYVTDGDPLPPYYGEPETFAIGNDRKAFAEELWNALDENNKISLYVRFFDKNGQTKEILYNKNQKQGEETCKNYL